MSILQIKIKLKNTLKYTYVNISQKEMQMHWFKQSCNRELNFTKKKKGLYVFTHFAYKVRVRVILKTSSA